MQQSSNETTAMSHVGESGRVPEGDWDVRDVKVTRDGFLRNFFPELAHLSDDKRLLAFSENRAFEMCWIKLKPKNEC